MDKIAVTKKQTIILNILFLTFPLSFILGHAFINLNLVLISLLTLIFFKKEVFKMNFLLVDKLFFYYSFIQFLSQFLTLLKCIKTIKFQMIIRF